MDFGLLDLQTTGTATLHLANTGNAPLLLSPPTLRGPDTSAFQIASACSENLAPGATCDLSLQFTPTQTRGYIATLTLASTDPLGPVVVPLTGLGAEPPGFTLTANGGPAASMQITSGATASFALQAVPRGGFNSAVSLRCEAIAPAPNATCTLSSPQLTMGGPGSSGTATISTLSGYIVALGLPFGTLLLPFASRRRSPRARRWLIALVASTPLLIITACGNGNKGSPYTPAGTYGYRITATAVSGPALTSSVILTVQVK